ncbi:MAG: hypothetical protein ACYSOV_07730 [Planctomycetota bacterium]|jgi:hypothetical protein
MAAIKNLLILCLILSFIAPAFCADVILNEYNAVVSGGYLGGGTLAADDAGGRASDSYFGRVAENGGDWFELVVITDHLDMRNWKLDIFVDGVLDETLILTNHSIWADLRSGTIITIAEDVPSDISYNPAGADWWIHVQANNDAEGLYIEDSNFPVSSVNWQLQIRDATDAIIFGPAGEGISPASGIGTDEVFKLKEDPSAAITPNSIDYEGEKELSTFGAPNQWGQQNLGALRTLVPAPSTLTLISPNGSEVIKGGWIYEISWDYTGTVDRVQVEFSIDNGITWSEVYPPSADNSGVYSWPVPTVNSEACLVKITNAGNPAVYDRSDAVCTIYECELQSDVTGDCATDLNDLAAIAAAWLDCANPYDPNCTP